MLDVSIVSFNLLPRNFRECGLPNNGCGKLYANYLKIEYEPGRVEYQSDAMESEDAKFTRDLYWIKEALYRAYEQGVTDTIINTK